MRKILVMMAVGVALLAMAPAAEAHWRNGYRAGGNVVVVRPFPRFHYGWGYPYWGGYYGGYYGYPYAYAYPPVVYTAPPPAVYAPPPPEPAAPAPDIQREVIYPHGKYVLEGDGMNTAYHWTWFPSPASAPPPPVEPSSPQSEPAKPKE